MNLARLYATENRLPEARREFERLATDFPENAELGLAIGLLSLQLEDFDTADQQLRKLLIITLSFLTSLSINSKLFLQMRVTEVTLGSLQVFQN
jgi:tetratricopeptide (TPR) repeat protein